MIRRSAKYSKLSNCIRNTVEYKIWRDRVKIRDKYKCVSCKSIPIVIHVDHIKSFATILKENKVKTVKGALKCKELWGVGNGRVLCLSCHKKTDTYFKRLWKIK